MSTWEEELEDEDEFENLIEVKKSWSLLCIDCDPLMFIKEEEKKDAPFQQALHATLKLFDAILLKRNIKVAIIFNHSNKDIRSMLSFDKDHCELTKMLMGLCKQPLEKLKDRFSINQSEKYKFSEFLIDCTKLLISKSTLFDRKILKYITVKEDPSNGDEQERFCINQELTNMKEVNVDFSLMPLKSDFLFENFYAEAFETMEKPLPIFYHNKETLAESFMESAQEHQRYISIKFYLNKETEEFFVFKKRSVSKACTLKPNQLVHRVTGEDVQQTSVRRDDYNVLIGDHVARLEHGKSDYVNLASCDRIKVGITLIYASKTRISSSGIFEKPPVLIKKGDCGKFAELWNACAKEGYYLLCWLKFRENSAAHNAELSPVFIDDEPHFKCLFVPDSMHLSQRYTEFPRKSVIEIEENSKLVHVTELIDAMTVRDLDLGAIYPLKWSNSVNYCKRQLLKTENCVEDALPAPVNFLHYNHFHDKIGVRRKQDKFFQLFESKVTEKKAGKRKL